MATAEQTTIDEFKNSLLNPVARTALGFSFPDAEALWIVDDPAVARAIYEKWLAGSTPGGSKAARAQSAAPQFVYLPAPLQNRNTWVRPTLLIAGVLFLIAAAILAAAPIGESVVSVLAPGADECNWLGECSPGAYGVGGAAYNAQLALIGVLAFIGLLGIVAGLLVSARNTTKY